MARPRSLLLSYFSHQTSIITQEVASQALRDFNGDIERAKEFLENLIRQRQRRQQTNCNVECSKESTNTENSSLDRMINTTGSDLLHSREDVAAKDVDKRDQKERRPPTTVAVINNLSDRQYCCVWSVEVYDDGYRPEVARTLLAQIAHHVNPILRARGWRVKRLMESASTTFIGCCTGNGRYDADAASTNIQLNLRVQPNKHCTVFRTFPQLLSVMLHEITHTSIGLEDIHPPAFYELMNEIKNEYREKLSNGEVDLETDMYGCDAKFVTQNGNVMTIAGAAVDIVPTFMTKTAIDTKITERSDDDKFIDDECGVKRLRRRRMKGSASGYRKRKVPSQNKVKQPPLLTGAKMIDKRTAAGKRLLTESQTLSRQELSARAAMARFGTTTCNNINLEHSVTTVAETNNLTEQFEGSDSDESYDDIHSDYDIQPHQSKCICRSCDWDRLLFMPTTNS